MFNGRSNQNVLYKIRVGKINAVREYLNIIFLSEISEPNGTTIAKGILYGNSGDNWYRRRTAGPKQSKPNSTSWNCWRRLIATFLGSGLSLRQPLGLWTKHHSTHGFWKAYLSSEFVYEIFTVDSRDSWRVHRIINNQLYKESTIHFDSFDPSVATPISINSFDERTAFDQSTIKSFQTESPLLRVPSTSWTSLLSQQPEWIQYLLEEVEFLSEFPNPYEIMEILDKHKYLLTVSDGSVKFHNMSFGWVLAAPTGEVLAEGAGPCNGRGNLLRSEGADMLTVTVFMSLILKFTGRDSATLVCISDNQELINRMTEHKN